MEKHIEAHNVERPFVVWMTGYSSSGKTTIANGLRRKLSDIGIRSEVLDGDIVRRDISNDLGFSHTDRIENIRRVANVAADKLNQGVVVIVSLISPYNEGRLLAKEICGSDRFIETFIHSPIEVCESRDVKNLYKKARKGLIENFTGISDIYQEPQNPDVVIPTNTLTVDESVGMLFDFVVNRIGIRGLCS